MAELIGPLTAFSAPDYCRTALLSCSTLDLYTLFCTPEYGLACGNDGKPTSVPDCFPRGTDYLSAASSGAPVFSGGSSCPTQYTQVASSTYTTSSNPRTTGGTGSVSYWKETSFACCYSDFEFAAFCQSANPPGPSVALFCDLASTTSLTVTYEPSKVYGTYKRSADDSTTTVIDHWIDAGRPLRYIQGPITEWTPTSSTSSTRRAGGYIPSSTSGSQTKAELERKRKRNKVTKIVIGVVVPVVASVVFALICFGLRRSHKKKKAALAERAEQQNIASAAQPEKPQVNVEVKAGNEPYHKAELPAGTTNGAANLASGIPERPLNGATELGMERELYSRGELEQRGSPIPSSDMNLSFTAANEAPASTDNHAHYSNLYGQYVPVEPSQATIGNVSLNQGGQDIRRSPAELEARPSVIHEAYSSPPQTQAQGQSQAQSPSELDAIKSQGDDEAARMRHLAALEHEQARINAEIEAFKNQTPR